MGSGGLRGLQILRSGANSVRGGFDSHAFPPSFARLCALAPGLTAVALALAISTPARAMAPARAAPLPAAQTAFQTDAIPPPPPDSSAIIEVGTPAAKPPAPGESPAARRGAAPARQPLTGFDAPRWVMARSLVVPGWGQLYNGSWVKAIGIATGEVMLGTRIYDDNQALDDLNATIEAARNEGNQEAEAAAVEAYNARLDVLTRRQWLFGALLAYSLLDAYIDAHFRHFDIEFRHDPALPGGQPPAPEKRKGMLSPGETRVALRWSF
jgi:uncharacterized protein DUF5683